MATHESPFGWLSFYSRFLRQSGDTAERLLRGRGEDFESVPVPRALLDDLARPDLGYTPLPWPWGPGWGSPWFPGWPGFGSSDAVFGAGGLDILPQREPGFGSPGFPVPPWPIGPGLPGGPMLPGLPGFGFPGFGSSDSAFLDPVSRPLREEGRPFGPLSASEQDAVSRKLAAHAGALLGMVRRFIAAFESGDRDACKELIHRDYGDVEGRARDALISALSEIFDQVDDRRVIPIRARDIRSQGEQISALLDIAWEGRRDGQYYSDLVTVEAIVERRKDEWQFLSLRTV